MLLSALSLLTATRKARRCTLACPAAADYRHCCFSCRDGLPPWHIIKTRVVSREPVVPGLTLRSRRGPTASHQARATGTVYIFCGPGLASCRSSRLNSNVRPGMATFAAVPTVLRKPAARAARHFLWHRRVGNHHREFQAVQGSVIVCCYPRFPCSSRLAKRDAALLRAPQRRNTATAASPAGTGCLRGTSSTPELSAKNPLCLA